MGVKTNITLVRLNQLFPSYDFLEIIHTVAGIMDTTYIVNTQTQSYILKHYERDLKSKVIQDAKLLDGLKSIGLNVSVLLEKSEGWYLYTKLKGKEPKHIKIFHIQALARFLSKMHNYTYKKSFANDFVKSKEIKEMLKVIKTKKFYLYQKYSFLQNISFKNDGIIHGDIFKDNTVFEDFKIGVFDFSDSGDGCFAFDAGITLFGFGIDVTNKFFIRIFVNTYNQYTTKKLSINKLTTNIKLASSFYGLKRVCRVV